MGNKGNTASLLLLHRGCFEKHPYRRFFPFKLMSCPGSELLGTSVRVSHLASRDFMSSCVEISDEARFMYLTCGLCSVCMRVMQG